ncbi:MAG: type III-B CRISPR module RAMP protein Cmr6 [Myxococcota bacterium]
MSARRSSFAGLPCPPTANAGLWLDRFLEHQTTGKKDPAVVTAAKTKLLREVASIAVPEGYALAYARWKDSLSDVVTTVGVCPGRVIVGLGAKGPSEIGIHLDRTWGVPVIPGTAQKGLAARAAAGWASQPAWLRGGDDFNDLFGTTEAAGAVDFLDAWWVPGSLPVPLHLDVMTGHHDAYYARGEEPPSDMDDPNPVSFLTASGHFLFAIAGPAAWANEAMELLRIGLAEIGVGAKTNSGYGRIALPDRGIRLANLIQVNAQRAVADQHYPAPEAEPLPAPVPAPPIVAPEVPTPLPGGLPDFAALKGKLDPYQFAGDVARGRYRQDTREAALAYFKRLGTPEKKLVAIVSAYDRLG